MDSRDQKSTLSPPPEPSFTIRTMKLDIESIQQTGGMMPVPQSFGKSTEETRGTSSYDLNGGSIFKHGNLIPEEAVNTNKKDNFSKGVKNFIVIISVVSIIIIGFILIGYFVIFPLIFKK